MAGLCSKIRGIYVQEAIPSLFVHIIEKVYNIIEHGRNIKPGAVESSFLTNRDFAGNLSPLNAFKKPTTIN